MTRNTPTVIVVGAGISGLAAASAVHRAGADVLVLEKTERVGGRIHSVEVNECVMEAGANFLTDAYRILPRLARDAGVGLLPVSANSSIVSDGRLRAFRSNSPATAVKAGVLSPAQAVRQAPGLLRYAAGYRSRGTVDPLDWSDLDAVSTAEWAHRVGLSVIAERSWRPAFRGFYFQDSAVASASCVAAMARHGVTQQTLTMAGGLSALPTAMAQPLEVITGAAVNRIVEGDERVSVHTSTQAWSADAVVVALPGPALARMLSLDAVEEAVASVPYSTGLLVGLAIDRRLQGGDLGDAYGVLVHPDDGPLASLCVASRAGHARGRGDLVTCLFGDTEARRLAGESDADIVEAATRELLRWAPQLRNAVRPDPDAHRVVRIPHAMPTTPPGRLADIAAYRRHAQGRRVVLAGDCLAWPWSDSAAFTGEWAADVVLRGIRRRIG